MKKQITPRFVAVLLLGITSMFNANAEPPAVSQPVPPLIGDLPPGGVVVVEASKFPKAPEPTFRFETTTSIAPEGREIVTRIAGRATVLQGRPERLSLAIAGDQPLRSVEGERVAAWAERREPGGRRFLDLFVKAAENGQEAPRAGDELVFSAVAASRIDALPTDVSPALPGPASPEHPFSGIVRLDPGSEFSWWPGKLVGLTLISPASERVRTYAATGENSFSPRLMARDGSGGQVELRDVRLTGTYEAASETVRFQLEAEAVAPFADMAAPLLSGRVALAGAAGGDGWRAVVERPVRQSKDAQAKGKLAPPAPRYTLSFSRAGTFPIRVGFDAALSEVGGWRKFDFQVMQGGVVAVELRGLPQGIEFDPSSEVVPAREGAVARCWLSAGGTFDAGWRTAREGSGGRLFVNSSARLDLAVGPGVLMQEAEFDLKVLQGEMKELAFAIEGDGEVLDVSGTNVAGWKVFTAAEGAGRRLGVTLSRPVSDRAAIAVRTQSSFAGLPSAIAPPRLVPEAGEVRHSGLLRVRSEGAVRFDARRTSGLMQLAPGDWGRAENSGSEEEEAGQVALWRFPSKEYLIEIEARQVFPEVSVNQTTIYEFTESDRVIDARVELDIREAPLREWAVGIPDGYAVASVAGPGVADQSAGAAADGRRMLRISFAEPVAGRALLALRLERSEAARPGSWELPPLLYPEAKAVRGFVGVVAAPGYRVAPGKIEGLAETPLNFFPGQPKGLQQAFRQRGPEWRAAVEMEALGQSVAADLFHLYSLKEGVAYGSVVMNFFVVGAPVSEWRIAVPEEAGNLSIEGQDVQAWRREGGEIAVTLNRPALGASTLLATFEQPMGAGGGRLSLGNVRPVGVASERGFIQVVSPIQVRHKAVPGGNLLRIEPNELPPELRLLTSAPSLAVFQYAARPFELSLEVEMFERAEPAPQAIDFAKLDTNVARDGQVVTDATYYVRARGVGALRVRLPEGAGLWEARVAGQVVNARADGDATLVPLPDSVDPEEATAVQLRYGWASRSARSIRLAAPVVAAPILATQWTARAEPGRVLLPSDSGTLSPADRLAVVAPTGFEWLGGAQQLFGLGLIAAAVLAAAWLSRFRSPLIRVAAFLAWFASISGCAFMALIAIAQGAPSRSALDLVAPVAAEGRPVFIELKNLPVWLAMVSLPGALIAIVGLALLVRAFLQRRAGGFGLSGLIGWSLVAAGALMQHGGAVPFLAWAAVSILAVLARPLFIPPARPSQEPRESTAGESPGFGDPLAGGAVALALAGSIALSQSAAAQSTEEAWTPVSALDAVEQRIEVSRSGVEGRATFTFTATERESATLLRAPGAVVAFQCEGARLVKSGAGARASFRVVAERAGRISGMFEYRLPLAKDKEEFELPTGPAASEIVELHREEPGWDFSSPLAISSTELEGAGSGTRLILGPGDPRTIRMHPKKREPKKEPLVFFAETTDLFLPGLGAVEGRHALRIRVAQGEISSMAVIIPEGFVVGSVTGAIFGDNPPEWRFDPDLRRLSIDLPTARSDDFGFEIATQRPAGTLPFDAVMGPVRVEGAAEQGGLIGLAFPSDAQPERVDASGLTPINLDDFDKTLLEGFGGADKPALYRVYRAGNGEGRLTIRAGAVEPEIRAVTGMVLSLGEERTSLSVDLDVDIRRAGLFRLSIRVPEGFEVESASGPSLGHWAEVPAEEGHGRRLVLNLRERSVGRQRFAIMLAAPPLGAREAWAVPEIALEGASRASGTLLIVPERGLRLRALARDGVSQVDALDGVEGDFQPGTLAFRLLQAGWKLSIGIERLDPWITAQLLHQALVREGQIRHRVSISYRIENAAVKALQLHLPGLDAEASGTVRAEGEAVSGIHPPASEGGPWEIRFRRGMFGEVPVTIEFQQGSKDEGAGASTSLTVAPARLEGAKQVAAFVAVRASGRLELSAPSAQAGWQRADWNAVPAGLRDPASPGVPPLLFRVTDPSAGPLAVELRRQQIADALKLRIVRAEFATCFSAIGDTATSARMEVLVNEKSSMAVGLPPGARLFQVTVNGEEVAVVRDGSTHLFYVLPGPDASRPSEIRLGWERPGEGEVTGRIRLDAPSFNVPLENVEWRAMIPEGWKMTKHSGPLALRRTGLHSSFGLNDYLNLAASAKKAKEASASQLMRDAGNYLQQGDQQRARAALSQAAKTKGTDDATNEDARVQLRNLYNQQALLGLNTRRQKLYLDNAGMESAARNDQIEQAARANPLLQGRSDFSISQIDQLLEGNRIEETDALRRVADRIVSQQIAAEPAPQAIEISLPERGTEVAFARNVQVAGDQPLHLDLRIDRRADAQIPWPALLLLIALPAAIVPALARRPSSGAAR